MRFINRLLLLVLLFSLLAGCSMPTSSSGSSSPSSSSTSTTAPGAPAKVSISGAKGVYLVSSSSSKALRTKGSMGRDVVTASDSSLGVISSNGTASTATFTDSSGNSVTVTLTKAMQLTSQYCLLSYTYSSTSATSIYDMTNATLTPITVIPAAWDKVFSRETNAWYVSSGTLYRLDLTSGSASALSSGAEAYASSGTGSSDATDLGGTSSWGSDTWCYADASGNAYAIDMPNTSSICAQAITASGGKVNFGQNYQVEEFASAVEGGRILVDDSTYAVYYVQGHPVMDNNPSWGGNGMAETGGYTVQIFPVTFDPTASGVMSFTTAATAAAYATMPSATTASLGKFIGFDNWMGQGVMSIGKDSFKYSTSAITYYDTSSVPVSHLNSDGSNAGVNVTNWSYSSGNIYAGPTSSSSTISLVKFGTSSARLYTLLTDSTVTSWSVVSGVLFYTNSAGTYKATVDTGTGTLGTASSYSDGTVTAVTQ